MSKIIILLINGGGGGGGGQLRGEMVNILAKLVAKKSRVTSSYLWRSLALTSIMPGF